MGNLLKALSPFNSLRGLNSPAHSFKALPHSFKFFNKGFEQGFYRFSTVLPASYYYYLYIYINPVSKRTIHKLKFYKIIST